MYQRSKLLLPTDCAIKPDSATSYPFAVYCRQVTYRKVSRNAYCLVKIFHSVVNGILRKKLNVIFKAKSHVPVDMLNL